MKTSPAPSEVGTVLEALRAEVRARRQSHAPDAQPSALDAQLARAAEQLEITRVVSAHWPLEARTPLGRAQNLANKAVRRALRWYINPIVEQQNAFNDVAARTMRLLVDAYSECKMQNAEWGIGVTGDAAPTIGTAPTVVPAPTSQPNADAAQHAALQRALSELASREPPAPLGDLPLLPLALRVADRKGVRAHWELGSGVGPAVQRIVRRYLRWLINPIVEQQNAFNAALAAAIPALIQLDAETRAALASRRWRSRDRETGRGGDRERGRPGEGETE